MMLALTVLLLLFSVVWPQIAQRSRTPLLQAAAIDVATVLRSTRTLAEAQNRPHMAVIDLRQRVVSNSAGQEARLPRDLTVSVNTARTCTKPAQRIEIVFAPDGSSCGGTIKIADESHAYLVLVNWLSGVIHVNATSKQ